MAATQYFPFLRWRRIVSSDTMRADLVAALTGTALMLPQGVAFATIAGLPAAPSRLNGCSTAPENQTEEFDAAAAERLAVGALDGKRGAPDLHCCNSVRKEECR